MHGAVGGTEERCFVCSEKKKIWLHVGEVVRMGLKESEVNVRPHNEVPPKILSHFRSNYK